MTAARRSARIGGTGRARRSRRWRGNVVVWCASILGEFFVAYGAEGTFRELLAVALLLVVVVAAVPDDVTAR